MSDSSRKYVSSCLILNIVCSILIVLLNKWLFTYFTFPNVTLTFIHFVITTIGLVICKALNLFQPKSLPILQMLPLASTFCGFVVFTNLSLQENTVGTYQLIKTMTTPCIMVIQSQVYNKSFSVKVKLTVLPIALGVFMNSYYDMKFSLLGVFYASMGVLVTSLYQVWVAEKQKEFQVNSMQLLYYQAPISAVLLLFVIPFFDPVVDYFGALSFYPIEALVSILGVVFLSGLVAFLINLSIFWIIGNTSPVTYNMVGHLKFCLTLLGSFLLFQEQPLLLQVFGIVTTLTGVLLYTHFKMGEQNKESLPTKL